MSFLEKKRGKNLTVIPLPKPEMRSDPTMMCGTRAADTQHLRQHEGPREELRPVLRYTPLSKQILERDDKDSTQAAPASLPSSYVVAEDDVWSRVERVARAQPRDPHAVVGASDGVVSDGDLRCAPPNVEANALRVKVNIEDDKQYISVGIITTDCRQFFNIFY